MEIKEAIATAQAMKNTFRAFSKIDEFLVSAEEVLRKIEGQEAKSAALSKDIVFLEGKKVGLEQEIVKERADFNAAMKAKETDIITRATLEAQGKVERIYKDNKATVLGLENRKVELEAQIGNLISEKETLDRQAIKNIGESSVKIDRLKQEIIRLSEAKNMIEAEVHAIKERFAALVK